MGIYPKDLSCGDLSEGDGRIALMGIFPWKEFSRLTVMEESTHGRISLVGIYPRGVEGSLSWGSIRGGRKDLSCGDLSEGDGRISLVGIYPKDLSCGDLSEGDGRISLVGINPRGMEGPLAWGSIRVIEGPLACRSKGWEGPLVWGSIHGIEG